MRALLSRRRGGLTRGLILIVAAVYFLGPLLAAFVSTLQAPKGGLTASAYGQIFSSSANGTSFIGSLLYSLEITVITIVITLGLMLPTQLLLHLRFPKVRGLVEVISLLPLVVPPVVLVVGVQDAFTWVNENPGSPLYHLITWMRATNHPLILPLLYTVLAMPFVYRSLDAGIRSIDTRTLVEASRNLGAPWPRVIVSVLMPGLRTAMINAAFLCFALVMGEYTISSILLYTKPFPVWLTELPTTSATVQSAISVLSLLIVEVLLLIISAFNWRSATEKKG